MIKSSLLFLGIICLLIDILVVLGWVVCLFLDLFRAWIWKRKCKRRFNRFPVAKCYCRDCKYRRDDLCEINPGFHVATHWFCFHADPIDEEGRDMKG